MANLRDRIKKEIEKGNLGEIFEIKKVTELHSLGDKCLVGGAKYPKASVRHLLANHSVGPGDRKGQSVKAGQEILFVKLKQATYSIFDEDGLSDEEQQEENTTAADVPPTTGSSRNESSGKDRIAADFVHYLRNKPFRVKLNKADAGVWYPEAGPAMGWANRLNTYHWDKKGWQDTSAILNDFVRQLRSLKAERDLGASSSLEAKALGIYNAIRDWGNPRGTKRDGAFILERLDELWNDEISTVDSTLTKLYAFANPEEYIIYDSRVATAILSIAEDIYRYKTIDKKRIETVNLKFCAEYPHLGLYQGAGGTRPRGYRWSKWPRADRNTNSQIDANDLCKRILKVLRSTQEDGRDDWTMREVEAVLFMEGY